MIYDLPIADFVDKHNLKKVGYTLLAMVQVGVVKTAHVLVLHLYFCSVHFKGFLNMTLQDRVLHRTCNCVYVTRCLSSLIVPYTSDGNINCYHGYHRYCPHCFIKLC